MERQGFEGRVTFDVTGSNLREVIMRQTFIKAVPECVSYTGDAATLFNNLIVMVSRTKAINLVGESDEIIQAMLSFWKFAQGNLDYRAVWDAFLDLPNPDGTETTINNEWMTAIIGDALKAPVEVRRSAPSDEELEQMGEVGQDFLERERRT